MHFVERKRRLIQAATAEGLRLLRGSGSALWVAEGRTLSSYAEDLEPLSTIEAPGIVGSIDTDGTSVLAVCTDGRGYYRTGREEWLELPERLWGNEQDVFCINDGSIWFVASGDPPVVCALHIGTRTVNHRFPLDRSWRGGSFTLWSGPPGLVAVTVPLDGKLGLARLGTEPSFVELPYKDYVIGFDDGNLVFGGGPLTVRAMPGGAVLRAVEGITPHGMVKVAGAWLVVSAGKLYRVEGDRAARVLGVDRDGALLLAIDAVGKSVVLVFADGELVVGDLV